MSSEKFLLNTTIWVKYLRGNDAPVKERVTALVSEERAYASEIIIMEILRGARSDKDYNTLHEDFLALPLLKMNDDVWETAWKTSYKLKKKGITAPLADTVIASIAIHYNCALIHSDRHYNLIAKHTSLAEVEL